MLLRVAFDEQTCGLSKRTLTAVKGIRAISRYSCEEMKNECAFSALLHSSVVKECRVRQWWTARSLDHERLGHGRPH